MKIYIVGNALVNRDSLPLRLLPELVKTFPDVSFEEADPNENFIPEEGSVIIDTVEGMSRVQWFDSIDSFVTTKSVSPHDYDLGFHLRMLLKLKKISRVTILGIPMKGTASRVMDEVSVAINDLLDKSKNKGQQ